MKRLPIRRIACCLVPFAGLAICASQAASAEPPVLVEKERIVEASPPPRQPWVPADVGRKLQINEIIAARELSRGVVKISSDRFIRVGANSYLRILSSLLEDRQVGVEVQKGEIYLHSRSGWGGARIKTPVVEGKPDGTQFMVRVEDDGTTTFTIIEGTVELVNAHGKLTIGSNEQAVVQPGKAPVKTAVIDAWNTVQWCLYYPAVIHLPEIGLTAKDHEDLRESIAAYSSGDLIGALDAWPAGYRPRSAPVKVFRAMLLLAVGEVDGARATLDSVPKNAPGRRAIEEMIDAVNFTPLERARGPGGKSVRGDDAHERGEFVVQPDASVERAGAVLSAEMKDTPSLESKESMTASEWLARSYVEQSRGGPESLERALEAARKAMEIAPEFGFAAVRVAELEFSFGHTRIALRELERGMQLTPRNAQAWALQGFLLSAQNRIKKAYAAFETAIQLDSALGNAWLGRGLCSIRQGRKKEGRRDLQTAVTLEPNRALLHSYLGKASSQLGVTEAGLPDLEFAKQLDPNDPTPWLYSAVVRKEQNQPNLAIQDLEESIALNDNRQLYRSRFLLDQDLATRSVNLANLYQFNGMNAVAIREATRAVETDYTNASAHLFLANAFDALRDPTRIELRYETPWFNELLLANLLSPVGGGPLSQFVSQQEYSKLLESDGIGANILAEYRSDSETRTVTSFFGTHERASFGIDVYYRNDDGDRINNYDRRLEIYGQFKYEVTPDDTFYFLGKWQQQEGGDTFKTFDNEPLSPALSFEESQKPGLLLGGWNHRWGPGSNTLLLSGRLSADQTLTDPRTRQLLLQRDKMGLRPGFVDNSRGFDEFTDPALRNAIPPAVDLAPDFQTLIYSPALLQAIAPFLGTGEVIGVATAPFDFFTRRQFEIDSVELQHIQEIERHTIIAGGRVQKGEFETDTLLNVIRPNFDGGFSTPAAEQHSIVDFDRINAYLYDYFNVAPWLTLIGAVSWDHIEHPDNFRNPPVNDGQREDEQFSGKVAFTLSPSRWITMRGAYMESLGGVTFDESVTLEPTQLGGFNQAYRTVLSESIAGSVETPEFTIWGLSLEGRLPHRTWWGARFNVIDQDVDRTVGAFTGYDLRVFPFSPAYFPDSSAQNLAYREESFEATINKLLGNEFAAGAIYRATNSKLRSTFPELVTLVPGADVEDEAKLHELSLFCNWNSPTGFFARVEANWYSQDLEDDPSGLAPGISPRDGDEFWQLNAFLGYRFNRNQGEISVGMLNIGHTDYSLSPLNPYGDLPRERTAVVRCRISF